MISHQTHFKVAVLSDIHGNYIGLNLCVDFLKSMKVEKWFCLGDGFGYLPFWEEVFHCLEEQNFVCIRGNHEEMLLGNLSLKKDLSQGYGIRNLRETILPQHENQLRSWPLFHIQSFYGRKVLFVHGSPWDYVKEYVYPDFPMEKFRDLPFDAIFMGHTHRPFIHEINGRLIVNVGACGLPRDQGNLASCAIYDSKENHCEIFRIPFNEKVLIEQLSERIHPQVIKTLERNCSKPIFGNIIR